MKLTYSLSPLVALLAFNALLDHAVADEALDVNQSRWGDAGISDYEFRYQKVCECHRDKPSDTIITIVGGEIVGIRYDREDYLEEIPVPPEKYSWFRTIDDLFSLIATAQEREAVVRVTYDPGLGYPTRIYIDYEQDLVGEEVELQILEFSAAD